MLQIPPVFTLMPQQSRMINATEGIRLEVRSGCLWLTRPGDAVDRFLVVGSTIDLHENQVLIQSDRHPEGLPAVPVCYVLVPLTVPIVPRRSLLPKRRWSVLGVVSQRVLMPQK